MGIAGTAGIVDAARTEAGQTDSKAVADTAEDILEAEDDLAEDMLEAGDGSGSVVHGTESGSRDSLE